MISLYQFYNDKKFVNNTTKLYKLNKIVCKSIIKCRVLNNKYILIIHFLITLSNKIYM